MTLLVAVLMSVMMLPDERGQTPLHKQTVGDAIEPPSPGGNDVGAEYVLWDYWTSDIF